MRILSSIALLWACLAHPAIRPFLHSLVFFLLLLSIEIFNVNKRYHYQVCEFPHPEIRPFVHSLVQFLLLMAIETFTLNNNKIFKCVRLVQIIIFVSLMSVYLPRPAINPFALFLVHFL